MNSVVAILSLASLALAANPTFPAGSFIASVPMEPTYHVPLVLGGHLPALEVLLDTGASEDWAVWAGCTADVCANHNQYVPSTTGSFYNFSLEEGDTYGDSNTAFQTWRVNDTVGFGSVTSVLSFGAAFGLDGSQALDGNFGVAKSCLYSPIFCTEYPSFVEFMYMNGAIKNAVLAFYQLASNDSPAAGVTSVAQIGGVDKNKYTGPIDWVPMNTESMWQSPGQTRGIQSSSTSPLVDITDLFTHDVITFDTGDPGLLGLPHNDWLVLTNQVGAFQDLGQWWFPCASTMSLGLQGSTGRAYKFALADVNNPYPYGTYFCLPLANDSGDTTNWIMGAPFLDQYYIIFHFVDNVIGFATKNLGASAATTSVLIGSS